MAKYFGKVGYLITEERIIDGQHTGIWEEKPVEREYYGDIIKNTFRYNKGESLNDNVDIRNQISILSDLFATKNFQFIRYVEWMGSKFKVESVEIEYPRITLSIGGLYNG